MGEALLTARRGRRDSFVLGSERGVYALFLRSGSDLPLTADDDGLLYIGMAQNKDGLKGRCHFNARTVNHSPRKSLAALLRSPLGLHPVLVPKPNGRATWGLHGDSDAKLTTWMHDNLHLAVAACPSPATEEARLIARHAPPLNLKGCAQTAQHERIAAARAAIFAALKAAG
jgi:hypothetical protein